MPPEAHPEFGSWSAEGHAIWIEYSVGVLEEICASSVDGLYRFRHGGMEVGGVLFGQVEGGRVRVLAFRELPCDYAFGPRFVLSERDRASLKALCDSPARDPSLRGLVAVGWYHSHTRSGIALSPRDLEIYDRHFPHPWQIALLIQPEHFGPGRAGFFFREADLSVRSEASYLEFAVIPRRAEPVEPEPPPLPPDAGLRGLEAAASTRENPVSAPPAEKPAPPVPVSPSNGVAAGVPIEDMGSPTLPSFVLAPPAPSRKWLWLALLVLVVGGGAFGVERYYRLTAPAPPLALWVADVGGQLLIEWDRTARPVRQAQSGSLEIRDGTERVEIQMDGDRLREGSVDYVRRTEVVDVRLRVLPEGRGAVQEYIRFVGQPVRRPAEADDAIRERDELKAEVDKLRLGMARKDAQIRRMMAGRPVPPAPAR